MARGIGAPLGGGGRGARALRARDDVVVVTRPRQPARDVDREVGEPALVREAARHLVLDPPEPLAGVLRDAVEPVRVPVGLRDRELLAPLELFLEEVGVRVRAALGVDVGAREPEEVRGAEPPVLELAVGVVEPGGALEREPPLARLGARETVGVEVARELPEAPLELGGIDPELASEAEDRERVLVASDRLDLAARRAEDGARRHARLAAPAGQSVSTGGEAPRAKRPAACPPGRRGTGTTEARRGAEGECPPPRW